MKENTAWLFKNLLLPLTPVICGSLTRFFYSGTLVFDITELAFSIAILYTLLLKSTGRLTDESLSDSLSTICFIGIALCLTIFTFSTFIKLQFENQVMINHTNLLTILKEKPNIDKVKECANSLDYNSINNLLGRVRFVMYVVAAISIPTSITFRVKYKLTD